VSEPPTNAGQGFNNFRRRAYAHASALAELDTDHLGIEPTQDALDNTVVVDLCGVNLAKQMHVGHLRATVIGDAIARLFQRLGHPVVRQNHFGDWGLPIAMVTHEIMRKAAAGQLDPHALTLEDLEREYRAAQSKASQGRAEMASISRFDLGPKVEAEWESTARDAETFLTEAKATLRRLQDGDPDVVSMWHRISDVTLGACFACCQRLQADVTEAHTAGESTYRDELGPLVDDLVDRNIAEESQGALVVRLEDRGIKEPVLVRKSDGGFLYATTDLAAIRRRVQKLGASLVVYAVDARQSLHFRQVFAAATKAGYAQHETGRDATLAHAAFGTVLGEDGRPFKTRSGENVRLTDLLDEAVVRAERAVAEKNPELSLDERRDIAEAVGIGAVKYADLSNDRVKDYVFSFDRMLAFEGATGPYLQYALVRVRSIFRKAEEQLGIDDAVFTSADAPAFSIDAPEEKTIALELLRYPEVVRSAASSYEPHRLCAYLYDLATAFSSFFSACPVLRADDDATRLARLRLTRLTGRVLEDGLRTLGITPLERM
ncbi:MAG: arginine--tRNA ligase, partial [Planctomycetota bacterium]